MAYWWVNQGQTWQEEIEGEYLWSPKLGKNSQHVPAYDFMTQLVPGDIVVSYFKKSLNFCGVVVGSAQSSQRPNFKFSDIAWNEDGWSVEMRYLPLTNPIDPSLHLVFYQENKLDKYSPINNKGTVQTQYLFPIPDIIGERYLDLGGVDSQSLLNLLDAEPTGSIDEQVQQAGLTPTERQALGRARIGQGYFKEQVQKFEPFCRLTGVDNPKRLVGSHMKPWSKSSNLERLDGANGLLLSPHVDHLFDRGFLSFRDNGSVVSSSNLEESVIQKWKLDLEIIGKPFTEDQRKYLEYHRDTVLVG